MEVFLSDPFQMNRRRFYSAFVQQISHCLHCHIFGEMLKVETVCQSDELPGDISLTLTTDRKVLIFVSESFAREHASYFEDGGVSAFYACEDAYRLERELEEEPIDIYYILNMTEMIDVVRFVKTLVIVLLIACLLLGCGIGYFAARHNPAPAPAETVPDAAGIAEEAPVMDTRRLDLSALRDRYAPDQVVGSSEGIDVTWEEYYYWLNDMGSQAQSYIDTMALYGQARRWDDKIEADSDTTFAQYTVQMVEDCIREMHTIESLCAENNVTLSAEDEEALAQQLQADIVSYCGEGATEEDFTAFLTETYGSRGNAANVSDEEALSYLAAGGYLCAGHILFLPVAGSTFEPLDEETVAAKLATAQQVSDELRSIEDVEARAARFAELKAEYCEDSGKELFPDGYLFAPGTMVTEFEDGVADLGEYEVSEPILSAYGYHVIMRLPLSLELSLQTPDGNSAANARAAYASAQFRSMVSARLEQARLQLSDELTDFDLMPYLVEQG